MPQRDPDRVRHQPDDALRGVHHAGIGGVQADGSTPDPIPANPAVASQDLGRIQGVQIALTVQDPADPSAHPVSVVNQVTLENVVAAAAAAARGGSA
jgi:hypothetical protein